MLNIRKNISTVSIGILNALLPILLAFVLGAIAIILTGENPLETYYVLFTRAFMNYNGFMHTLHVAGPLILTGLAIAISFKAGLFNMGVEGQLLVGGFMAAIIGYRLGHLPSSTLIPLCLILGSLAGMFTALIPALLKAYLRVNELVVTLLLNYAIFKFLEYLTSNFFRDASASHVSTHMVNSNAIIQRLFGTRLTMFFFIALAVFCGMYVIFKHSKLGYELTAMGSNLSFAEAVGMNLRKKVLIIMLYSGALSGLAGAGWMLSAKYSYTLDFSGMPGLGWDGMLIALLGSLSPIGVLIAAIFYAGLKVGILGVAVFTNVPAEIVSLIQALLILFLSVKLLKQLSFRLPKSLSLMAKKADLEEM